MPKKGIFETEIVKNDGKVTRFNFPDNLIRKIYDKASAITLGDDDKFKCVQLSHIDWDGYSCVGLLRQIIEATSIIRTTNTGYSNVGKNFMNNLNYLKGIPYGVYFITDVSFNEGLWEQLMVQSALFPNVDFIYIDHHQTSQISFVNTFDGLSKHPNVHVLIDSNLNSATEIFARHLFDNNFINNITMGLANLVSVWDVQLTEEEKYKDAADFNQLLLFFNNIERNNKAMEEAFNYTEASIDAYHKGDISLVVTDILTNIAKYVTKDDVLGVSKNKNEMVFKKLEEYIAGIENDKLGVMKDVIGKMPGVQFMLNTILDIYPDIDTDKILITPSLEGTLTSMSFLVFGKYDYDIMIEVAMLGNKVILSTRSRKGTYTMNNVCARLGGGGHPNAAGCTVGYDGLPFKAEV